MQPVKHFLFPFILLGMGLVFGLTRLLAEPGRVVMAAQEPQVLAAGQSENIVQSQDNEAAPACRIASRYPAEVQQWCDLITASAEQYGLDPNLVAAVILQESGGDASAYSRSGAVGLMQVMPSDGLAADFLCINGPCFASRPTMEALFDGQFNIDYGTRMLSGLINKHGDLREALLAYGPMDIGYRYADTVLSIYQNYQD
jgi:soluble lytic murein transglycosylase-like protein